MTFNFNLKGRGPADAQYTLVKARLPDLQAELEKSVLAASLATDDSPQAGTRLILLRQTIRQSDRESLARVAIRLREELNFHDLAYLLTAEMAAIYNDERMARLAARVIAQ